MIGLVDFQHGFDSLKFFLIFMLNHDGHGLTRTAVGTVIFVSLAVMTFPRGEGIARSGLWLLLIFPALWIFQTLLGGMLARDFLHTDEATRDLLIKIPLGTLAAYGLFWLYCHVKFDDAGWFVFVVMIANLVFMLCATMFALMQISGDWI